MTIGVGYLGDQYVFLGSDMELTKTAKYKGSKDHFKWFNRDTAVIAAIYSGSENDMRCVWEQVENAITERAGELLGATEVRFVLQESLSLVITDPDSTFEMLVAISLHGEGPLFLRIAGNHIAPARDWELIGGGDVELSRHLTSLMNFGALLTRSQSVMWGTYIIGKATDFVQGVGQGIRLSIVIDGRVHYLDGDIFGPKMKSLEEYVSGVFHDFCNLDLAPDELRKRLDNFPTALLHLRSGIINIFN
jgi:hypothetical protein